jgi:uncharacterized protein
MNDKIITILKQIEEKHEIKILYACEAGSRAWGLDSTSSDYDVRFIYIHPKSIYLSIDPIGIGSKKDTIELYNHENIEISGWDLTKALRLFRKSNPSLLEWLQSPKQYYQAYSTIDDMNELLPTVLDYKACTLHYLQIARSNFNKTQKETTIHVKIILNILRPIFIAKWVLNYHSFPPLDFQRLVNEFIPQGELKDIILSLITLKRGGMTKTFSDSKILLEYTLQEMDYLEITIKSLHKRQINITEELNAIFRNTLNEIEN